MRKMNGCNRTDAGVFQSAIHRLAAHMGKERENLD